MSCDPTNIFYANPNAPTDDVPCNEEDVLQGAALVFAAAAGTLPPFPALFIGQEAINETTNEEWFTNQAFQWQQTQGV
jgi:hypothetical protein